MPPNYNRRDLLVCTITGGVGALGVSTGYSVRNQSGDDTLDNSSLSVEGVVRIDKSTYEVTFSAANAAGVDTVRSRFIEGTVAEQPPRDLGADEDTFTVRWTPNGDSERLVWEVDLPERGSMRAATPTHRTVREQWTLTLEELRERFDQFDPTGITVRTGAQSQRTMYLHGEPGGAMFRIWTDRLVSYRTDDGWWEVDVSPSELLPTTEEEDVGAERNRVPENQYTFTVANSPYDGSQWMSTLLREGKHWGATVFHFFPDHGQVTAGLDANQPDEIYSRISFRLADDWEQPDEGDTCKIYWAGGNLSAGGAGKGGTRPTGDNGWSVRVYLQGPDDDNTVSIGSYVYHLDQDGQFGDLWEWPDEVEIGKWNHVETYVRLNSVSDGEAKRDGVMNAYLNDSTQIKRADVGWRTTEDLGFDRLGPGAYWGGTEVSPRDNYIYYDDFRFNVTDE